jgi:hypothetical protein
MISPFSTRQVAAPSGCQPVKLEPLSVASGVKDGPAVFKGTDKTAMDEIATSAGMYLRAISDLTS